MKSAYILVLGTLIVLFGSFFFFSKKTTFDDKNNRLGVIVTVLPYKNIVERIGQDKVNVSLMVPPGASPHTYEPTPSQLTKVEKASIYIKVGTPVEFEVAWLDKIMAINNDLKTIDSSAGVDLLEQKLDDHNEEGIDPHIWVSPKNMIKIAENVYQGLSENDPDNKQFYLNNKNRFIEQLKNLDGEIEKTVNNMPDRRFIVFHPAWGYLANSYGLQQVSIETNGKEPSAQDIRKVIDFALNNNIKTIFASPQFSTKSAQTVAREIHGNVVLIDPLMDNYIDNISAAVNALSQ